MLEAQAGLGRRLRRVLRPGRTTQLAAALGVALVVLLPGAAMAVGGTTLYVDRSNPSCSDNGSGTSSQPFCTIGAAAQVVAAGQTVQVAAGTYTEDVTVRTSGTSSAPIVFTAAPGATVTVTGQDNGFTVSSQELDHDQRLQCHEDERPRGPASRTRRTSRLSNNHVSFSGHPVSGQTASGIHLSNTTDSLLVGNTVDHNTDSGIQLTGGSTRDELRANVCFSNAQGWQRAATGIRLYSSPGNIVDQQHPARQRGLRDRVLHRLEQHAALRQRLLQQRRPRHRQLPVDRPAGDREHGLRQRDRRASTSRAPRPAPRSRTTSASTTGSTARGRTATSGSSRARRAARRSTTTSSTCRPPTPC